MELKLLYSYEEWLKLKDPQLLAERLANSDAAILSEENFRLIMLSSKMPNGLTEDEQKEYCKLRSQRDKGILEEKYTYLYYSIVDMCLNPQGGKPKFREIGKLQCELVRMIYPIVVPKKDDKDEVQE